MIKDRYDGVSVGIIATELWIEKNAILSFAIGKLYFPKLRIDLDAQDSGVLNGGVEDTSNVYELISTMESNVSLKDVLVSTFGDLIVAQRVPNLTAQFHLGLVSGETIVDGSPQISIAGEVGFENLLEVASTGVAGSSGSLESKNGLRYIPGYEFGVWFTALFTQPTIDGYVKAGLFETDNGFWIGFKEHEGSIQFGLCRVKNGVEYFTPQSEFNIDKLDGTAESKFTIDTTKGNIFLIRGGYLGFAPIVFSIKLPNGSIQSFHMIEYPNSSEVTHISNTNLPVRAEISNGTQNEIVKVRIGSISAFVSDGSAVEANTRKFSRGISGTLASGAFARRNLIAFKNEGTFSGGLLPTPKTHRISAILDFLSITLDGQNKPVLLEILVIPAADLISGTFTTVDPDSILEISQDAIYTLTNAKVIFSDSFKSNIADKIELFTTILQLNLRPEEHAMFALTSDSTLTIDYVFSNAWSELW